MRSIAQYIGALPVVALIAFFPATASVAHTSQAITAADLARADLLNTILPATYTIRSNLALFKYGSEEPLQPPAGSVGFAFGITEDGLLITNAHVVGLPLADLPEPVWKGRTADQERFDYGTMASGLVSLSAYDHKGVKYPLRVVAVDAKRDLAIVALEHPDKKKVFPFVEWATDVEIGQAVVTIGAPFGQSFTIGEGIVSKTLVDDEGGRTMIQTNALMHPGNSGGPLVRLKDHAVLGVDSMIFSPVGIGIGIGFAISATTCLEFIDTTLKQPNAGRQFPPPRTGP